ncbi:conserved hypothetical protein [Aspergillus fumigatus Af293]|uniref:FluG domain-containing protein n=1 Tax=Aspergillus fumigatus (strain ATCC MYA-4609 / CBS 101355 / FGSC A1100 / Af293) TaxID=330879 RepID=Q4WWB1_ASPFU|nr:conserved hypothetical protein [Aspergillus fumigatus Af293]EAL91115.2 conserved hypothetical protein [Aspergillus fumigatus Af293]
MSPPPLPPADPNEHQYWTDPILCEETRARLEHFRSIGWLPPNFKPKTLEGLAVVERYWRRFCIHSKEDYVEYLLLEDQTIYMNFFDWMYRTSRQKLLQSYDEYWRRLCQYFGLFARRRLNGNVYEQMRRFLNKVFPAERKIPRRMKKKDTLDVNVFCILYRQHWIYSRFFRHGSMIIQFAVVQLWSAITGTRPGVLLPQKASQTGHKSSLGKRKREQTFQSDLPKHVSADDLPDSVCYRDIELFILKDPDSKRDVLCAIIEFRNLKGRPEGADGTKFFMHGDYQMAYCPINQIISLAFRDGAFVNPLTPELIWRLRVPKRRQDLPLRWKEEILDTPLLRRIERTPHGYELHKSLPMTYDSSRQALKELGRDAKFEDDIGHYNYRRWVANEVNRNFTSQERQRVLGQSGDAVFERHYQSQFIGRDLQHVVLLRPSQEGLLRVAGSMLRKRDPLAPSGLTDQQKRAICRDPRILELRREQRELKEEMRSLAGTVAKARESFPHLHERHEAVKKELSQSDAESCEDLDSDDEDWDIPIPEYVFPERARLVENFYGPEAECFDADKLLARRIQVTKDMVALSKLCEPSRRGNQINWDVSDGAKADETEREESEESPPSEEEALDCPTDVCIICCGLSRRSASNPPPHKFPSKRKDSLRRHLIDFHLARAHEGISCTWSACCNVPKFAKATEFLAHAVDVHSYDIGIKLKHLPSRPLLTCSDTSSIDSTDASLESCGRSGTSTPASSVGSVTTNIDPRLLELDKGTVTEPPPRRSKRVRLQ